jgi:hypothetical protein
MRQAFQLTSAPSGYDEIVAAYGDPDIYRDSRAQLVWAGRTQTVLALPFPVLYIGKPIQHIVVHRRLVHAFATVFKLLAEAGLQDHVREYNGTYCYRAKRGVEDQFSVHTFSAAIDLNASTNPLGGPNRQHPDVCEIFARCGFVHGADFKGVSDPMHWQFARGY